MTNRNFMRRARLGTAMISLATSLGTISVATPAAAQQTASRPSETLNLSQGTGTLVRLAEPMSDLFIASEGVADVQVRSPTQLYIFGKGKGETTIYASSKSGRVVYAANVRVGNNISSVDEMLRMAMPEAAIQATPMNNLVLLTGTVSSPEDGAEAQRLVQAYIGDGTQIVSRIRTATPLQVNLKVRIAEVNRSLLKEVGLNLLGKSQGGFDLLQGDGITSPPSDPSTDPSSGVIRGLIGTTLGLRKNLFGLDLIGRLNLAETDGLAATLAEPNLTALSGETASFLAGGEFPVPIPGSQGAVTVEYKQYGVSLSFTPFVLADGRISMRVRPEVSELSNQGSVKLGDFIVPALTTRRAETTVELGSGQSFMIAGLLRNSDTNDVSKAPFLGDLPILGTLFRSSSYRKQQTELVIIVTPYLVRPVSGQLALPTDGYRAASDPQRILEGKTFHGNGGNQPPRPAPAPAIGGTAAAVAPGFKL
jgi:pilus assembly protein CpaC